MPKGARKPTPGGDSRPPSLRGLFYVSTPRGNLRYTSWPKPRGPNRHPTNQYWTKWLKAATYLYRYQPASVQFMLQAATKGTVYMPRDVFISAARGRAWLLTDENGRKYYPRPMRDDVSDSLDAICQLEGQMMYRGATLWEPIPDGTDGQLLTLTAGLPTWSDPPSTGLNYAFIPVYRFSAIGRTTGVNNLNYFSPPELEFFFDCSELSFDAFRILSNAASTQANQTINMQLAAAATPGTPLSAAGADQTFTSTLTPRDTGWITVPTPLSALTKLTLALQGSNATVDLTYTYLELHLRAS